MVGFESRERKERKKGERGKERRKAGQLRVEFFDIWIFEFDFEIKIGKRRKKKFYFRADTRSVYIKIDKFNFRPFVTAEDSIPETILSSNNSSGWEFCDGFDLGTISIVK